MSRILTADQLGDAARLLASGALVAFPTETVYGLGADATNPDAVARIFAAKDRPPNNPLIVHLDSALSAPQWAAEWPQDAEKLARAFWPGPLTLVVPAGKRIAPAVLAGGDTVGLRVPAHAVALALLRMVRLPIAAPSANRSNRISPTRAEHVAEDLGDHIDAIVDGGACTVGIESTVCEVTSQGCRILRPGAVSARQITDITGKDVMIGEESQSPGMPLRSPGRMQRHYAPRIPLFLVRGDQLHNPPPGIVVLGISHSESARFPHLPASAEGFAQALYAALRQAESTEGALAIWLESPPQTAEWDAVWDRLRRAAVNTDL